MNKKNLKKALNKDIKKEKEVLKETIKGLNNSTLLTRMRKLAHQVDKGKMNEKRGMSLNIMFDEIKQRNIDNDSTFLWAIEVYNKSYNKNEKEDHQAKCFRKKQFDPELFLEILRSRRSVRQFKRDIPLQKNVIKKIAEAGCWSPSSCNRQTQKLLIVTTEEGKKLLNKARGGNYSFFMDASALILMLIDMSAYNVKESTYTPFLDAAASIQNILLMIHALGLGGCWINFGGNECSAENLKIVKSYFRIPLNFRIISLIAVGFPSKSQQVIPRKSIDDIMVLNRF